jgi:hypothetical protein
MAKKKRWIYAPAKAAKPKVPDATKQLVQQQFNELIETELKPKCIQPPPTEHDFNYLVDIFGKWYRNYFYICGTYNCPSPRAIAPSFEEKFARFEYVGPDQFNVAYMRHTGQFWEFMRGLSLEECLHEAKTNPLLHPV